MRVIFMGTPDFGLPTLNALVDAGHDVICVVAQPDRPKGRGRKLQSPPTVVRARELGIEVRQPRAVRRGPFPEWMESAGADVAVVVAYGRILTPRLLAAPRLGCINVHASLLPRYRGAAPIQWSVIEGEAETGVCTMQMDVGLDTGDVLLEERTPIGPDDTAADLWARLSELGAGLLVDTLARLDALVPAPQDHSAATLAPLLKKEDGELDWTWPAQRVHDRVRGVSGWPAGQTALRGEVLRVHKTRCVPLPEGAVGVVPGQVVEAGKRVVVAAGDGAVELLQVQLAGKRAMGARDALVNGARLMVGECFGAVPRV